MPRGQYDMSGTPKPKPPPPPTKPQGKAPASSAPLIKPSSIPHTVPKNQEETAEKSNVLVPATHGGPTGARRMRGSDSERSSVGREGGSGTPSTSTDETPLSDRVKGLSVGEGGKKRRGEDMEGNSQEEDDEVVEVGSSRRCSTEYLMM